MSIFESSLGSRQAQAIKSEYVSTFLRLNLRTHQKTIISDLKVFSNKPVIFGAVSKYSCHTVLYEFLLNPYGLGTRLVTQ